MIGAGDATVYRIDNRQYEASALDQVFTDIDNKIKEGDFVEVGGFRYSYSDWNKFKNTVIRDRLLAPTSTNQTPGEDQLKKMNAQISDMYNQAKDAKKNLDDLKNAQQPNPTAITEAETKFNNLKEYLQHAVRQFQQLHSNADTKIKDIVKDISPEILQFIEHSEGSGESKAQVVMQNGGGAAGGGQKAMYGGGTGFMPPTTWAAQTAYPPFSTSAYMQSTAMEGNILSSFDAVLQNQNKGKQLMMLFFYFARMAESGDLGAMYQFMKFLTFIISKDKAKQQIDMGKKLIELQDLSRKWTDKLLGMQTNANDPNSSNEFMKVMTQVKSETDAIATSQKLISQMMEEFSQIVETLTNSTKSSLDANGRVLRVVSSRMG
jgi:hypothetical protein